MSDNKKLNEELVRSSLQDKLEKRKKDQIERIGEAMKKGLISISNSIKLMTEVNKSTSFGQCNEIDKRLVLILHPHHKKD